MESVSLYISIRVNENLNEPDFKSTNTTGMCEVNKTKLMPEQLKTSPWESTSDVSFDVSIKLLETRIYLLYLEDLF